MGVSSNSSSGNIPGATSFPSHQLNNGLYVSGRPDAAGGRERAAASSSATAMPYTGGDIKKSGELGRMVATSKKSGSIPSAAVVAGGGSGSSFRATGGGVGGRSASSSSSGQLKKSGPLNLPPTGLITSAGSSPARKLSGVLGAGAASAQAAVTNLSHEEAGGYSLRKRLPPLLLGCVATLSLLGLLGGTFIAVTVHNPVLLILVAALLLAALLLLTWNAWWGGDHTIATYAAACPAGLAAATDGDYVRVTGVVTCGSVHLESPYSKVSRCVYTAASLYEYRGGGRQSKAAKDGQRRFTWGVRHVERHAVDFYISDLQSGARALVKAGYGGDVTPVVRERSVVEVYPGQRDVPPAFTRWLHQRNLSHDDDRRMRLTEGFIREGSTATVVGAVQRSDNVLMLVPPPSDGGTGSTGCQWSRCLLPLTTHGLLIVAPPDNDDDDGNNAPNNVV